MKEKERIAYIVGGLYICSKLIVGEIKFKNIVLIYKCKLEENNSNNNNNNLHDICYMLGIVP